ncbi:MAG TPA: pyridoxal-phosphate dependent enzyme [Anaerolineales bacterium]|nr:pyridoxal-phosphate dependent enzyme [Anaerolineales bacterium]
MNIACVDCGQPYPESSVPYKCSNCGGLFDFAEPVALEKIIPHQIGIWRYAASFGLQADSVSLGEGNTPLLSAEILGRKVYFKCENLNPSGSFKDRGTSVLVTFLKSRGVTEAMEDSSGNAGASFAAYAVRAGIKARVYVPESASGPKRRQIEAHGAELIPVAGPRQNASQAVMRAADEAGMVYASHAYLPFNLLGYATCAYEVCEQLGRGPGAVILPAGQGGFLLGMARGFEALFRTDRIQKMPMLIGVQASACAPLYALWNGGTMDHVEESPTIAEGVRNRWPVRAAAVVQVTRRNGGRFVAVDEAPIVAGRDALAHLGFYVEPTSALVWRALEQLITVLPDPVVVVLTGSGLKYSS